MVNILFKVDGFKECSKGHSLVIFAMQVILFRSDIKLMLSWMGEYSWSFTVLCKIGFMTVLL